MRLNAIYTRTGDGGQTGLGDGSRRSKCDARINAIGDVDETNCAVGIARLRIRDTDDLILTAIEKTLAVVQNDLFDVGADLCLPMAPVESSKSPLRIVAPQVDSLERAIDSLVDKLNPLKSFVLPGGTPGSAALHQARAVCRRAERSIVALVSLENEQVNRYALAYVNRLSDYLFVAARACNNLGRTDVLWVPGAHQVKNA